MPSFARKRSSRTADCLTDVNDTLSAPLAVSIGEPAGIGPDVILQLHAMAELRQTLPPHVLLGDPDHLAERGRRLGLSPRINVLGTLEDAELDADCLNVLSLKRSFRAAPSQPDPQDGAGVIEAIDQAVALCRSGLTSGMVTLPIHKKTLYDAGFTHPGHTEYLGALASRWFDDSREIRPVMMLASTHLRTVPVTIHVSLSEVPRQLTTEAIVETAKITVADLQSRFGIPVPKLAISGLNPHAGEGGALGREDGDLIAPAIETLRSLGIDCVGPLPADTMFHARARAAYDVAICMYHDQALIPAKALAFDEAVNVTLGLPFIRTSPDHGTAFDIAGTGKARPDSVLAALNMAWTMAEHSASQASLAVR